MTQDARFPDTLDVEGHLRAVLGDLEPDAGVLIGIDRRPNPQMSSAPSEVVTCRFGSGERLPLLLKYDHPDLTGDSGHWVSVGHEIRVYRDILQTLPVRVPRYYGAFTIGATGQSCLVLEWVDGQEQWEKIKQADVIMMLAAQWLGQFHAAAEAHIRAGLMPSLETYNVEYYTQYTRRIIDDAGPLHERFPWLRKLCKRFEKASPLLANGALTLIHGEYYVRNILWTGTDVCTVDWQSAAIARGEVDVASLTEGWDQEVDDRCESEYVRSRWGGEAPGGFHEVLALARVYWPLRWLSRDPRTIRERHLKYLDSLPIMGARAGLL